LINELRDRYAHDRGQLHAGMVNFSRPREPTDIAKNESFKGRFRGRMPRPASPPADEGGLSGVRSGANDALARRQIPPLDPSI